MRLSGRKWFLEICDDSAGNVRLGQIAMRRRQPPMRWRQLHESKMSLDTHVRIAGISAVVHARGAKVLPHRHPPARVRRFLTIRALHSLFWPALPSYPPFFLLTVAPFPLSALFSLLRRLFERFLAHPSVSEVSGDSSGCFGQLLGALRLLWRLHGTA